METGEFKGVNLLMNGGLCKDNLNMLDLKLTDEEMAKIAELDKNERYYHRTDEQLVQFAGWRPDFEKA